MKSAGYTPQESHHFLDFPRCEGWVPVERSKLLIAETRNLWAGCLHPASFGFRWRVQPGEGTRATAGAASLNFYSLESAWRIERP